MIRFVLGSLLVLLVLERTSLGEWPALKAASETKERIKREETQLLAMRSSLATKVAVSSTELSAVFAATEIESLAALRPAVQELREVGRELVSQRDKLKAAYGSLKEGLRNAPTAFAAAGRACRQYAAEESYSELRADYVVLAEIWERLAQGAGDSYGSVEAEQREVEEILRFIEHSNLYLERLDAQLAALPTIGGDAAGYTQLLKRYVQKFESLRVSLWDTHERIGAGQGSSNEGTYVVSKYRADLFDIQKNSAKLGTDFPGAFVNYHRVPVFSKTGAYKGFARGGRYADDAGDVAVTADCDLRDGDYVVFARLSDKEQKRHVR